MATVGEAYVKIIPDASGFAAGLKSEVDGALKGIEDSVSGVGDKIKDEFEKPLDDTKTQVQGLGEEFKKLGKLIGAAAVGRAVVGFAKDSIAAASDLNESINAVQVTFGDLSDEILAFSKNSATAVGLSSADFNSFAVRFAGFTKVIASGGKTAADVTTELTTRIADFASVMNLDLNEAATVFASTLAGESEAIRRFGIDMSAASIEAFALSTGLIKTKDEMTASIKVQATYAKLMHDTAQVAGDFANTSGGLANQQRILAAQFKDLQATIGAALVPVLQTLISVVEPLFNGFMALPDPIQQVIAVAGMAAGAFWAMSTAIQAVGVSAATANPIIAGVVVAVGAIALAYKAFTSGAKEAKREQDQMISALKAANDPTWTLIGSYKALAAELEKVGSEADNAQASLEDLGSRLRIVTTNTIEFAPNLERAKVAMEDLADAAASGTDVFEDLYDLFGNLNPAKTTAEVYDALALSIRSATKEGDPLRKILLDLAKSGGMTVDEFRDLLNILDSTADGFDQAAKAANREAQALLNNKNMIAELSGILGTSWYGTLLRNAEQTADNVGRTDEWTYALERVNDELERRGYIIDPTTNKLLELSSAEGQAAAEANRLAKEIGGIEPVLKSAGYAWDAFVGKLNFQQAAANIRTEIKGIEKEYGTMIGALMSGNDQAILDVGQVQLSLFALGEKIIDVADIASQNLFTFYVDTLQIDRALALLDQLRSGIRDVGIVNGYFTSPYGAIPVKKKADGGLITRPELTLMGEAGPEVVIPLTRPQRAMELMRQTGLDSMVNVRQSSGATVNIEQAVFQNATDANLVAQKVNAAELARSFAS